MRDWEVRHWRGCETGEGEIGEVWDWEGAGLWMCGTGEVRDWGGWCGTGDRGAELGKCIRK